MRALITGGAGLVGSALAASAPDDVDAVVTVRAEVDLRHDGAFARLLDRTRPDVVIHTAYSKADHDDTVAATASVAAACGATGVALVHFSTDAVFDGEHAPYDESSPPSPVHAYGRAKAETERLVAAACPDAVVIRTSLVLAADASDGTSAWAVEALRARRHVTLFHDEYRTPILVEDLAAQTWEIVGLDRADRAGMWHLGGVERLSRVEIGHDLCRRFGLDAALIDEAASSGVGEPRPRDVSLSCERARHRLSVVPRRLSSIA